MFGFELLENAALLLALCFLQRFIVRRWNRKETAGKLASGILFGGAAAVGMVMSIHAAPGVIFDARSVVLSMGALFGGPTVGLVAAGIAAVSRIHLGGGGVPVGMGVIASSVLLGLAWRHHYRSELPRIGVAAFVTLGLTVNLVAVGWFYFLPIDFHQAVLRTIAVPFVAMLTFASAGMGLLLREIEANRQIDRMLGDSRARYRTLFDSATVALLEMNVTTIFRRMRDLRDQDVRDLRHHLAENPDLVDDLIDSIRMIRANPAALALFGISSERAFRRNIGRFFGPETRQAFIDSLCALWNDDETFTTETAYRAADGRPIPCVHSMPVPRTAAMARRVPVSIVDISAQKAAARQLAEERRRLQEILWGTNAGTWEWSVQTGELTINARWAEIAGYTLDELSPVSIQTWIDLAHPDDLKESNRQLQQAFERADDYYDCEVRLRHKAGHWVWIQDRGKVVEWTEDGKPRRMSGTHMEITKRENAEERARRLSKIRATILRCHAAILREQDETRLLQRVAEILAEDRDYALVWIGRPLTAPDMRMQPVARAGDAAGYVDHLDIRWGNGDGGDLGSTADAVRTGKVLVLHDLADILADKPWADEAERHGFKSYLVAPIRVGEDTAVVLYVYSSVAEAFDDTEIGLISEFSSNIGQAVQAIRLNREATALHSALEQSALGAVRAIAATIEKRDPYTSGHQENVAAISVAIAERLGWGRERVEGLRLGAMIHDIGKIYIPSEILNRPGRLTDSEFEIVKSHPQVGYDILANTEFPWPIKEMVVQHHERLDGSGYPKGLMDGEIIDEAKVIAVADVVDAITSHRPYRPGLGVDAALAEIEQGRGALYDTMVADACLRLIRDEGFSWGELQGAGVPAFSN